MDYKKHFKLYKSGKLWCIAAITVAALTMTSMSAHADDSQTTGNNNSRVTTVQTASDDVNHPQVAAQTTIPQPAHQVVNNATINTAYNDNGQLQAYGQSGQLHDLQSQGTDQNVNQNQQTNNALGNIQIDGDLTGFNHDTWSTVRVHIKWDTNDQLDAWGTVKAQGDSSTGWPAKNYRLKLFKDEQCTDKLKLMLPGSGFKTNSFNIKSYFTDASEALNIVDAEIAKQIYESNSDGSLVAEMPNYGEVAGRPLEMIVNGLDQGLYVISTYHQDKLFGLDDKKADQIAISGTNNDQSRFQRPITLDDLKAERGFEAESPEKLSQATVDKINELYELAHASGADYQRLENQYLDVNSAINYLLFSFVVNNSDGLHKNVFYVSKDGSKWSIVPYDFDLSWNYTWGSGTGNWFMPADYNFENRLKEVNNLLFLNIYNHHMQDIIDRYKQLRSNVLSTGNIIKLFNDWYNEVGMATYRHNDQLWTQFSDLRAFPHIPFAGPESFFQFVNQRMQYLDRTWGVNTTNEVIDVPQTAKVTRTFVLSQPDGTEQRVEQLASFTRDAQFDTAADRLTTSAWQADGNQFPQYDIPQFSGYTSLVNGTPTTQIGGLTVNPNEDSQTIVVKYVKTPSQDYNQNDNNNYAHLDDAHLHDTYLHVAGWHASNQTQGKQYHYIILWDVQNQHEITRQRIDQVQRDDVERVCPVYNADESGFNTDIQIPWHYLTQLPNQQIQVISRWTNDPAGNGNYCDYWFSPISFDRSNNAWLDKCQTENGQLHLAGWNATNYSEGRLYHYIIILNANTNREIARQLVENGQRRDDVAAAYPDIAAAHASGFDINFGLNGELQTAPLRILSRYSSDPWGNTAYVDYYFNTIPAQNGNFAHLDNLRLSNGHIITSGWNATNQAIGRTYHWLIVLANGREIGRQLVKNGRDRQDVADVYQRVNDAAISGFSNDFDFSSVDWSKINNLQIVSRYSDNGTNGEGSNVDYWFDPIQISQGNFGHLDRTDRINNRLTVSGWSCSNQAAGLPYRWVIIYDRTKNCEISRQKVSAVQRPDVANVYPLVSDAVDSGFDTTFTLPTDCLNDNLSVGVRYSDDRDHGEGKRADYWFDI